MSLQQPLIVTVVSLAAGQGLDQSGPDGEEIIGLRVISAEGL